MRSCARQESHIAVDETGASERILGAKLIDLPSTDGKLHPDQLDEVATLIGNAHHAQPSVVSVAQSTELGTLYTPDEVAAICDRAHRHGMTRPRGRGAHRQRCGGARRRRGQRCGRSPSRQVSTY